MTDSFPKADTYLVAARNNVLTQIRHRRRARSIGVIGGVMVLCLGATGAALAVPRISLEAARTSVVCFAHDDLNSLSGTVEFTSATSTPGNGSTPSAVDKRELCATVWRGGIAEAAANGGHWPNIDPNTSTLPVPPLAFCVMANGQTAGLPIESPAKTAAEVCENLGLPVDDNVK